MPHYMKLADERGLLVVRGDVKAKGYEGWISLTSAQMDAARVASTAGLGAAADRGPSPRSITVTKDTDATTVRLFHLGSTAPAMKCTIVVIADGATTPYMTIEIWRASILIGSGRGGDQIEIVGDIKVELKTSPPPPPPRRDFWLDGSRSYG
jgi:type VI protein secretion system component Hcp